MSTPEDIQSQHDDGKPLEVLCLLPERQAVEKLRQCLDLLKRPCMVHWPVLEQQTPRPEPDMAALADALGTVDFKLALVSSGEVDAAWRDALDVLEGLRPELPRLACNPKGLEALLEEESGQGYWEQRYAVLAEASTDCVLHLDAKGRVLQANSAVAAMFGTKAGECQGKDLDCLGIPEDMLDFFRQQLEMVLRKGQSLRFCWSMHNGQTTRHFETGLHIDSCNEEGEATILVLLRDVSFSRNMEQTLCQNERKYRFSFEQAAIGMVHTDLHGVIQQVNASFAAMLDRPMDALVGMRVEEITHPEDQSSSESLIQSLQQAPWGVASMEKRYLRKNGDICWARTHVSIVTDSLGGPLYFVAQVEDISESKRLMESLVAAKEQAEAASRVKTQFLSNMSHELRTPLNAIIGMTQLAMGSELDHEQHEQLESVLRASRSLLGTVNRLLELSTLESHAYSIQKKSFTLRARVAPLLETMAKEAWSKGLLFNYAFSKDVPAVVRGDADKILQVLLNIVDNAIKFTEQGSVSIGVSCDDQPGEKQTQAMALLQFSVKDTGVGIPRDKQETVFEPFSLAEDVLTKRYGGMGLGLAVSRDLVEHMGGRIWVRSKPGQGSAFFFTCPVEVVARQEPTSHVAAGSKAAGEQRYSILVAEDEPINQELTRKLLQRRGHSVKVAADGQEALEMLQRRHFDLVLMDIQMPRMNGLDAVRLLREGAVPRAPRDLPVIALTAYAAEEDRRQAMSAGMNAFVAKPFDAPALCQVINEVMAELQEKSAAAR